MTENLLLHAQSLREDGDIDASIELLRVVILQCNLDLDARNEKDARPRKVSDNNVEGDIIDVETTGQLRQMAAYQLALLLLQRSGRQSCVSLSDIDEKEADDLLRKLGYRLRLSKMAFGYPLCCGCHQYDASNNNKQTSRVGILSDNRIGVAAIDKVLPSSIFDALKHAYRPGSRYWSEFYNNRACDQEKSLSGENDNHTSTQRSNACSFASHNIPLPRCNNSSSAMTHLPDVLQRSKSLLEQVAIITQHRLQDCFPGIRKATSVEVWSHRRSSDGHHQLHYDMDEIKLWKQRLTRQAKRHKPHSDTETNANNEAHRRRCNDSISCPIVSCVLTIDVPGESVCSMCGRKENCAPTIICNQSIIIGNGCQPNTGCLCFPIPNRLLAFEGSLMHGVIPGIPFAHMSNTSSDESDDREDMNSAVVHNHRITFMMGFWETVCTTPTNDYEEHGPNVPFDSIYHNNTWTEEFKPHSITGDDIAAMRPSVSQQNELCNLYDICPLWVPVIKGNTECDKSFGEYSADSNAMKQYGRFFLKSQESTEIDREVLNGEEV